MASRKQPKDSAARSGRDWRDVPQTVRRPASTAASRARVRRMRLRIAAGAGALVALCGIVVAVVFFAERIAVTARALGPDGPVEEILFHSDGVLGREWFLRAFAHLREEAIMEIDIYALKLSLESVGQVRQARVERRLPGTLKVHLHEHEPVLRARVAGEGGSPRDLLVARDGTIYTGYGYPVTVLQGLPYIGGVRFSRHHGDFLPLEGMDPVAALLDEVRMQHPEIYRTWSVVVLDPRSGDPASPPLIRVQSTLIKEIVFAPHAFDDQVARLADVVEYSFETDQWAIRSVDLSLNGQAIVQYLPDQPVKNFRY